MALYQKVDGVWTLCQRPYVHRNGVWTAASEGWVKRSGVWTQAYLYDVTPPDPPEITLQIVEDFGIVNGSKKLQSRWIKVGVRLPGASNDPTAKLSRVLTTYNGKAPTTPMGGTYTSQPDSTYPSEPWSDWRYNDYGPHNDSSVVVYKQWPRNAQPGTIIKGDTTYYFGGWSEDAVGNWSAGNQASIHVPKDSVDAPSVVIKEARFQPNSSGSWRNDGFASGDLIQQNSPRSVGLWFYGGQITDSVGAPGAITIRQAQIFIAREDDGGQANANVYLYWTNIGAPSGLPSPGGGIGKTDITKIGTLAKGQSQWFDIPQSFYADLSNNIKSMGLDYKDPVKAGAFPEDYSSVVGVATNLRCGELHLVWEETL